MLTSQTRRRSANWDVSPDGCHWQLISSWWSAHVQRWLSMRRPSTADQLLLTTTRPEQRQLPSHVTRALIHRVKLWQLVTMTSLPSAILSPSSAAEMKINRGRGTKSLFEDQVDLILRFNGLTKSRTHRAGLRHRSEVGYVLGPSGFSCPTLSKVISSYCCALTSERQIYRLNQSSD